MAKTRTGGFGIGFRSVGGGWQQDTADIVAFAVDNGFESVDIRSFEPADLKRITEAGLRIGTIDLIRPRDLLSKDAGKRRAASDENVERIRAAVGFGARSFFSVAVPEDAGAPRNENFSRMVDGFGRLCGEISSIDANVVLEGWPGPGGSALGCTPADYRALLKEIPRGFAINFDPSHLIRMGIDSVRFLEEFVPHVHHVHAKDTEIMDEELYEHGHMQDATFAPKHGFGGWSWRYTIPGHGKARWTKLLSILTGAGYKGMISIELEDERFNGTESGERAGFLASRAFLESA